ncbi:MAG TPA: alpha/beta hydrolase [Rhizomicrobium sp.]
MRKARISATGSFVEEGTRDARLTHCRPDRAGFATLRRFAAPDDSFVPAHIGAIKCPTLILWGEEDRLIPLAAARAFAKAIAGAKLIVYPATGHIPQEEVPDQSAADVKAFLLATARP